MKSVSNVYLSSKKNNIMNILNLNVFAFQALLTEILGPTMFKKYRDQLFYLRMLEIRSSVTSWVQGHIKQTMIGISGEITRIVCGFWAQDAFIVFNIHYTEKLSECNLFCFVCAKIYCSINIYSYTYIPSTIFKLFPSILITLSIH